MTDRLPHGPRSDARDNRGLIVDAARATFLAVGLDVPIREVARRAQVAPATVYRHFPTKEVLAAKVFTEQTRVWRSIVDAGLADPDPWRGFCRTIERLCARQALDREFTTAFKSTYPRAVDFAAMRARSLTSAAGLIRRAKDTGRLRPDVVVDDVVLVLTAVNGLHASTVAGRVAAARRFAALVIPGFST
ncbi:helix-turn-helix domain-containing protein [Amycolatopsis dongchuanensis]|uniref:TetR/AcrR family transcriptional regulator n=1 Tax=Amycolatopsis dongchuanensis TaxID=1070866 RepID=UPI0031F939B2